MALSYEIEGTVLHIFDLQTFSSGFSKREFVVEVPDGKFTQKLKFECLKDKAAILDNVSEGDEVLVNFDLRGNEYKDRFFVNLNAWKVSPKSGGGSKGGGERSAGASQAAPSSLDASLDNEPDESDDIPF